MPPTLPRNTSALQIRWPTPTAKEVERLATGTTTDEAAATARQAKALPFGREQHNPYAHLDKLPTYTVLPGAARRWSLLPPPASAVPSASSTPCLKPPRHCAPSTAWK